MVDGLEVPLRSLSRGADTDEELIDILLHDLPQRSILLKVPSAHKGKVTGLCWADAERLLTCGMDKTVKLWDVRGSVAGGDLNETVKDRMETGAQDEDVSYL